LPKRLLQLSCGTVRCSTFGRHSKGFGLLPYRCPCSARRKVPSNPTAVVAKLPTTGAQKTARTGL
jgi:hypothetical protein